MFFQGNRKKVVRADPLPGPGRHVEELRRPESRQLQPDWLEPVRRQGPADERSGLRVRGKDQAGDGGGLLGGK